MTADRPYEARIQEFYAAGPYSLGWRFLYGSERTLLNPEVVLLGLNPGGRECPDDHGEYSCVTGSAYRVESWKGKPPGTELLQREILALFDALGASPDEVLAGNLVPFRSPSWDDLPDRKQALEFGTELWREIIQASKPDLIVCLGAIVFEGCLSMGRPNDVTRFGFDWGNYSIKRAEFGGTTLIGLPHLSRFPIVTRPASQPGLRRAFGDFWRL